MDGEAVLPDSRSKRFGFGLLSAFLAFVPLLFLLGGVDLIDMEPLVGVRPGVASKVSPGSSTPITDCGGSSWHIIRHGPQVRAELMERARVGEAACREGAWIAMFFAVVLFLLIPVSWYGAFRAMRRYTRGGRLVDAEHSKQH